MSFPKNLFIINSKFKLKLTAFFLALIFFTSPFSFEKAKAAPNGGDAAGVAGTIAACFAGGALGGGAVGAVASAIGLVVPTNDAANTSVNSAKTNKDCTLDGIANGIKRVLVRTLVDSTVNWINGGFDGEPAFGKSLEKIGTSIKGAVLDEIIYGNNLQGLCTDFEDRIKFALHIKFFGNEGQGNGWVYTPKCTIDDIRKNAEKAAQGAKNFYSWNSFLAVTTDTSNNTPFGVYFKLANSAEKEIAKRKENFSKDLETNEGFLSIRKCDEFWAANRRLQGLPDYYDGSAEAEKNCDIITPGTVLSDQLKTALGTEMGEIIAADEFDEIIAALIGQLVNRLSEGGVRGFNSDGKKYSESEDPALDAYKKSYIKKFDTRAYDIAIKILNSKKRTVLNARSVFDDALFCWESKNDAMQGGTVFYAFSDGRFVKLNQNTVSNAMAYLAKPEIAQRFQKELDKINSKISKIRSERQKAEGIKELIIQAKSFSELSRIVAEAGIDGVDLNKEIQEKEYIERIFDEMVNGKIVKYGKDGPVKRGGLGSLERYCAEFNASDEPPTNAIVIPSEVDPTNLKNTKNISVIDPYDPADDLYNLEDNTDYSFEDQDYEENHVCEDSGTIKCMGELDTAISGTLTNPEVDSEKTLVYTISPENRVVPRGRIKIKNLGDNEMTVSLSDSFITNSSNRLCRKKVTNFATVTLAYNSQGNSSLCDINEEKVYFLRISSNTKGSYEIITYGDGSNRGGQGDNLGNSQCVSDKNIRCQNFEIPDKNRKNLCSQSVGADDSARIGMNQTNVYPIRNPILTPDQFSFRYVEKTPLTVSVSEWYNRDSDKEDCTKLVASAEMYINDKKVFGQCQVDKNKKYYLRVTSPVSQSYCLFWNRTYPDDAYDKVVTKKCVPGPNLVCKGDHQKLVFGGNIQDIFMAQDAVHVWEFEYKNNSGSGAETILNIDPSVEALSHLEIDFTINQDPGNMNKGVDGQTACIRKNNVIGVSNYRKTNFCQLVEGQTYFLNMHNLGRKGKDGIIKPTKGYYTIGR